MHASIPTVCAVMLVALTAMAAATDLWVHKIYNWTTYPGILLALVLRTLEEPWPDPSGLEDSLKGLAVCGGVMLVAFVLFNVGGGDVKLCAMLGAFLGFERGIEALLWTFVLGGAFALGLLIWRVGFWRLATSAARHAFYSLRLGTWQPLSAEERKELEPPLYLAAAALVAVVIVVFDLVPA
jgi:prepilin peptidase CpaA